MLCSDSDDSGFENVSEEDLIEEMPPGERQTVEKKPDTTEFMVSEEPSTEGMPLVNNNQYSLEPDMIFG